MSLTKRDIEKIRLDFRILNKKINGKDLVYFDNAATTLKPNTMNDAIYKHYNEEVSNINRAVHYLSEKASDNYDKSRKVIANLINANDREIIFNSGTTFGLNFLALALEKFLNSGDEIIISKMEHHANIVPWQLLKERKDIKIRVIPLDENGEIIYEEYLKLLNKKTKIVSVSWISNLTGIINPIKKMIKDAHKFDAKFIVDAAQASAHTKIDVKDINCDFLVFSAHKHYGPTGLGVLYGKKDLLEELTPIFGGGDMIDRVSFEKTTYNSIPHKFEAGTPNIASVIAFSESVKYLENIGIENIKEYEDKLQKYASEKMKEIKGLKILGDVQNKSSIISFVIDDIHPLDIAMLLNEDMIAIRTGHMCAQPLLEHFSVSHTARISFGFYNTFEEIDFFIEKLKKIYKMFK